MPVLSPAGAAIVVSLVVGPRGDAAGATTLVGVVGDGPVGIVARAVAGGASNEVEAVAGRHWEVDGATVMAGTPPEEDAVAAATVDDVVVAGTVAFTPRVVDVGEKEQDVGGHEALAGGLGVVVPPEPCPAPASAVQVSTAETADTTTAATASMNPRAEFTSVDDSTAARARGLGRATT